MNKNTAPAFFTGMFAGIILTALAFGLLFTFKDQDTPKPGMILYKTATDSVTYPVDSMKERYFLVAFSTRDKDDGKDLIGQAWFSCQGFPEKVAIENMAYDICPKSRKCYQHVIILNLLEMSAKDYADFDAHSTSDPKPKKKSGCCVIGPGLRVVPHVDDGWLRANSNDYVDSFIQLYKPDTLSYWYTHRCMDSIMVLYRDRNVPSKFDTAWISDNRYPYTIDSTKP